MGLPKAYGTFIKRESHTFRTEAKLKWGDSEQLLGLLVMLNPGSSMLKDTTLWDCFESENFVTDTISGEIILDDTMEAVVNILEESHKELNGVLVVHNLFNLRDSESKSALESYKSFFSKKDRNFLYNNFKQCVKANFRDVLHTEITTDYINAFPWVWLAWSVEDGKFINARRRVILDSIPTSKRLFAIYSHQKCHQKHKELYTYHVCPRNPLDKKAYKAEMINLMKA